MNKFIYLCLITLFLAGCTNEQTTLVSTTTYTETNIDASDKITDRSGRIENKERFDEFLEKVQRGEDDRIRIIRYTVEGDPIYYDYDFNSDVINVTIDTRKDGYGSQEVIHAACTSIKVEQIDGRTYYQLDDCIPKDGETVILVVD